MVIIIIRVIRFSNWKRDSVGEILSPWQLKQTNKQTLTFNEILSLWLLNKLTVPIKIFLPPLSLEN